MARAGPAGIAAVAEYRILHCGRAPVARRGGMLPTAVTQIQSAIRACGRPKPSIQRHSSVRNKTGLVRTARNARPESSPAPQRARCERRRQPWSRVLPPMRRHGIVTARSRPGVHRPTLLAARRATSTLEPPPIRPDRRRNREGLGVSLGLRLCRSPSSARKSSPAGSAGGAAAPRERSGCSRRRCNPALRSRPSPGSTAVRSLLFGCACARRVSSSPSSQPTKPHVWVNGGHSTHQLAFLAFLADVEGKRAQSVLSDKRCRQYT